MHRSRGLSRREFLKLISLVPVGIYSRPMIRMANHLDTNQPNIIILVFDAWSQQHVSLYGYRRPTMPNLEKFAERFTVYHNHYSAGNFTVPGTSSILTGMHPWSHRAFQLGAGIAREQANHTMFSVMANTHSTLAFAQNKFADQVLLQALPDLDQHVDHWKFNLQQANTNMYGLPFLKKNERISFASIEDNLIQKGRGFDSSLFFGPLARLYGLFERKMDADRYGSEYPLGMPDAYDFFRLPDVVDGAIGLLKSIEQPTLAYIHFYPPHEPYRPTKEFFNTFADGWKPLDKPVHDLSYKKYKQEDLNLEHQYYDEFLASWDHEVARLFQYLEESGLFQNSYIIVTSDHGDLFERGELGHWTPLLYDPVVHVPLLISSPGQTARQDVRSFTSSVDLLPTIAFLTGNLHPDWTEGSLLPTLGGEEDAGRSIYSMDAKTNSSFGPLRNYSMSLTRGSHRLIQYSYPKDSYEKFEFYNLDADPDEMKDLYPSSPSLALQMRDELLQKVSEVNKPYERNGL